MSGTAPWHNPLRPQARDLIKVFASGLPDAAPCLTTPYMHSTSHLSVNIDACPSVTAHGFPPRVWAALSPSGLGCPVPPPRVWSAVCLHRPVVTRARPPPPPPRAAGVSEIRASPPCSPRGEADPAVDAARGPGGARVLRLGLGCIVVLYCWSSTLCQIR
jgi:hypothetical protein